MESTVRERLIKYLKYSNLSQRKFEIEVGLSNGYVNNINKSIQPDKIQKITLHYQNLNTGWLLTGEGEMLKNVAPSDVTPKTEVDYKEKYYDALEELLEVRRGLDELKTEKLNQKDESPNAPGIVRSAEAS